MSESIELPHTAGCLVCGHANPHGLRLSLHVNPSTGLVHTTFTPTPHHIGFEGLIHGGVTATVLDEAMVWAAIWHSRRSCVAGELAVRFKQRFSVGQAVSVEANILRARSRMIEVEGAVFDAVTRETIATASGKYVPLELSDTAAFLRTLVDSPTTLEAVSVLSDPLSR